LALTNLEFGLALMKPRAGTRSFYALQASGSGKLVGIEGVKLKAPNLNIQVNGASPSTGPAVAVNFGTTFGTSGLSVPTGSTSQIVLGDSTDQGAYNAPVPRASGPIPPTV